MHNLVNGATLSQWSRQVLGSIFYNRNRLLNKLNGTQKHAPMWFEFVLGWSSVRPLVTVLESIAGGGPFSGP